eukprot:snap_masked-scaffold450_size166944-processed-gene-0.3 protein:Tk00125 transcript:snap_masked-scaffold450_size166944-processed-gene-0.3-mRNA-1 annotation:"transcriptional regulator"
MHTKPIAPKIEMDFPHKDTSPDSVSSSTSSVLGPASRCRRKIAFHPVHGYAIPPPQPAKVARRNARERNRVKQVNCGFEMLRHHIPSAAKQKKMSKVDTLRHAVEYIQNLQDMLLDQQQHPGAASTPMTPSTPTSHPALPASSPNPHPQHFVYPATQTPLTPQTPAPDSSQAGGAYSFNESGYETSSTSSYFSSGSLISPVANQHGLHSGTPYYGSESSGHALPNKHSQHPQHLQSAQEQEYFHDSGFVLPPTHQSSDLFESNSEEDELLDVIAKWQEEED